MSLALSIPAWFVPCMLTMRVLARSWHGSEPTERGFENMSGDDADAANGLRREIAGMLAAGLVTQTEPIPEDTLQVQKLVLELQHLPKDDLRNKLIVSGMTNHAHGEEGLRCKECMYYLIHRRWCELPELDIPVGANWWCRLWRI